MQLIKSDLARNFLLGFVLAGGALASQHGLIDLSPVPQAIAGSMTP